MLILRQSAFSITLDRSRWQKKAREFSMHSGCIETIAETIAWSDLCETGTNRSIDVSALRAWLTCLTWGSRAAEIIVQVGGARGKNTDRHLLKHTDTEEICRSRWLSERILCSPVKPLTWDHVHMTMCGKNRYRLAQTISATTNGTRNSELNKGGTKTRLCISFFAPSFLGRHAIPSYQDKPLLILALSGSGTF